jgi:hypothetical protein
MRTKEVVIVPISISKAGQICHFQVKLPKNTKCVTGVQLGARWTGQVSSDGKIPMPINPNLPEPNEWRSIFFQRNILLGEVKLQSCEKANIFYAGQVQLDNNLRYGVFGQNNFWRPQPFTQQIQWFEDVAQADGISTIIQGVYQDRYGTSTGNIPEYTVNVYVWTEIEK